MVESKMKKKPLKKGPATRVQEIKLVQFWLKMSLLFFSAQNVGGIIAHH